MVRPGAVAHGWYAWQVVFAADVELGIDEVEKSSKADG